ncbi:MAG: ATP synthase subunit I [Ottowia sp.]|nr:ATP synthase subunit I [Ottowia sp.]
MPDLADAKPGARGSDADNWDDWDANQGGDFLPLSAEQARQWRQRNRRVCLWCVSVAQLLAGGVVALLMGMLGGPALGWSAAFGALAVIVPTVFFLYRTRRLAPHAGLALLNLVVSEFLKILWVVILLLLAPWLVPSLSWPALLVGMLAAIVTYVLLPLFAFARSTVNMGKEGG